MNSDEYAKLERIDKEHWFYRGKRAIIRHWMNRYLELKKDDVFLDAGCGTGTLAQEMTEVCRVIGLDDHEESLELTRPKIEAAGGRVLETGLEKVDLEDGCAAVVVLSDVLEHIDDDAAALREMARLVRPGGLILITVPALMLLWSDWDEALHHRRRYTKPGLMKLFDQPGMEILRCTYTNTFLLPAILLVRMWRKLFPPRPGADRAEDKIPPRFLNSLLFQILVKPACWGWFPPPAGVSLLAVLRKQVEIAGNR